MPTQNFDSGQKNKAARLAREAIAAGKLVRLPCSVCGSEPTHAHHEDYARPLDVVFLCPLHHNRRHKELGSYPRRKYRW